MYTQEQIEQATEQLREALGDNITWKYEPRYAVMLSEFAQNKSDAVFEKLSPLFCYQWEYKTAKKMPKSLKQELRDLARIGKNQKLLVAKAAQEKPAIAAFWWPWGHGGTYSLRLKLLENDVVIDEATSQNKGLLSRLFSWGAK